MGAKGASGATGGSGGGGGAAGQTSSDAAADRPSPADAASDAGPAPVVFSPGRPNVATGMRDGSWTSTWRSAGRAGRQSYFFIDFMENIGHVIVPA